MTGHRNATTEVKTARTDLRLELKRLFETNLRVSDNNRMVSTTTTAGWGYDNGGRQRRQCLYRWRGEPYYEDQQQHPAIAPPGTLGIR